MYERFYQLRNRPFALSPDPDFLYPSRVHREALDYLRFGIEGHAGFVVITGEIGSGKTTLLQVLLRTLDGQTTVIRLVNTLLTGPELIESMLLDLGVATSPDQQARDAARAGARAGRAAATAGTRGRRHRRGPEPVARRARRAAHALQPRDGEVEADTDRPRRTARPSRLARAADARATAPAGDGPLSHRSARRGRDRALHQPPPEPCGTGGAIAVSRATSRT